MATIAELLAGLRGAGEETRLRLLFILSHGEFNVSELTSILGQSQPRVSRHLKLLVEAGLLQRYREGAWMLFRLAGGGSNAGLARLLIDLLDSQDPQLQLDIERIGEIKAQRRADAQAYFAANADNWHAIRACHVSEEQVEAAVRRLAGEDRVELLVDLGTGTGRILQLLAPLADSAIGVDLSREMLNLARADLDAPQYAHVQVRLGDICRLGLEDGCAGLVTLHQVLHFLDEPELAIAEAVRILAAGGRLLVVDFAPHGLEFLREDFAHRRLGIAHYDMEAWAHDAGARITHHEQLSPPAHLSQEGLRVAIWVVRRQT